MEQKRLDEARLLPLEQFREKADTTWELGGAAQFQEMERYLGFRELPDEPIAGCGESVICSSDPSM